MLVLSLSLKAMQSKDEKRTCACQMRSERRSLLRSHLGFEQCRTYW